MDILKLHSFIAVAKLGSISDAADELFLTPSAVSKHIASLEKEFGCALFHRSQKKLSLNTAGESCLLHAERIFSEYTQMLIDLCSPTAISIVSIPGQGFLASSFSAFEKLHPNFSISITEKHGPEVTRSVKTGNFELAFAGSPCVDKEIFEYIPIKWTAIGLVVSENHALAGADSASVTQLKDEKFYFMSAETGLYDYYRKICNENGFEPRVAGLRSREDTVLSFVAMGGATFMSEHAFSCYPSPHLRYIPLKEKYWAGPMLIKKRGSTLSKNAKLLWDFFAEHR